MAPADDRPWALFDIDETLTYFRRLKHGLLPPEYQMGWPVTAAEHWNAWEKDLANDQIDEEMAETIRRMSSTHRIGFVTTRSERVRGVTEELLKRANVPVDLLAMRPEDKEDWKPARLKSWLLDRHLSGEVIDVAYDDARGNLAMFRGRGIKSELVTPKVLGDPGAIKAGKPTFISNFDVAALEDVTNRIDEKFDLIRRTRGVQMDMAYSQTAGLPYRMAEDFKAELRQAYGFNEFFANYGAPRVVRESTPQGERGFARYMLDFTGGTFEANEANIAMAMQNFQIDPSRLGEGDELTPEAFRFGGKQIRPEVVTRLMNQWNVEGGDYLKGKSYLVFDVESAGLEVQKGVWQVSARGFDAAGRETNVMNSFIENDFFKLGNFGTDATGRNRTFREFIESQRADLGEISWIGNTQEEFYEKFARPFIGMVDQADVLVGQNTLFDVEMLSYAMQQTKFYKNNIDGFKDKVDNFRARSSSMDLYDTKLISQMMMHDLAVDPHLAAGDRHTAYSLENILTQTDFLERLEAKEGREAIEKRLALGLHYGDVDTWFEGHYARMQQELRAQGQTFNYLRHGARAGTMIADDWAEMVRQSASMTLFTNITDINAIHPGIRNILEANEVIVNGELVHGITPLQQATLLERNLDTIPASAHIRSTMFANGMFDPWLRNIVNAAGEVRKHVDFGSDEEFRALQEAAEAAGVPFAHLSKFERMFAMQMGEVSGAWPTMARSLGAVLPQPSVRAHQAVGVYGRNLAVPVGLLQEAEEAGVINTRLRNLGKPVSTLDDAQEIGWSFFRHFKKSGKDLVGQTKVAMTVDAFKNLEEAGAFFEFMKSKVGTENDFGITPAILREIEEGRILSQSVNYGLQLGVMEGNTDALFNLADQYAMTVDKSSSHRLRSLLYQMPGDARNLVATPGMLDTFGEFRQHGEGIIANMNRLRETSALAMAELENRPHLNLLLNTARTRPGSVAMRNITALSEGVRHLPKAAGIAGLALAGYYMTKKVRRQNEYDETIASSGYEDSGFYNDYKRQMNEPIPEIAPKQNMNVLETAGLVQDLHREKTKHHMMGQNKNAHLYQGV